MFGVDTTSFVFIIGALTVGIGMTLNMSIGHLANGVMQMIFRSFKVGNLLEIDGGYTSTVESINTFNSTLATLDNERTFVANCNVAVNNIINISGQGVVRVELTFGIDYSDDVDKAQKVILEVGKNCPHILDDPAQGVFVAEFRDRSVNLSYNSIL